jgi:hypothetical protein
VTAVAIRRPAAPIALIRTPSATSPILINMGPLPPRINLGHCNRAETPAGQTRVIRALHPPNVYRVDVAEG